MSKITIFGLAGTGKTTVGKIVAEKLGYPYMSTGNIFRAMAEEHGMTLNEFEVLSETDEKYDRDLDQVKVTEYGRTNNDFVLESRLAWYFVPDSIKIRLYCEDAARLERIANREEKDITVVKQETDHREESIYKRYEKLYGITNINNPDNFDFNIDTTHNDANRVVEMILEFIKQKTAH